MGKDKIGPAVNRIHQSETGEHIDADGWQQPYTLCIASQCAMWRWGTMPAIRLHHCNNQRAMTEDEAGDRHKHVPDSWLFIPDEDGDGAAWIEPEVEQQARRLGYCGLAGKPGA